MWLLGACAHRGPPFVTRLSIRGVPLLEAAAQGYGSVFRNIQGLSEWCTAGIPRIAGISAGTGAVARPLIFPTPPLV